jgi:hypothetical protein
MTDTQEDVVARLEYSAERARKIAGGSSGGSQIVLIAQAELYESAAAEITSLRSQNKGMREALTIPDLAGDAYEIADAMLAARNGASQ